MSPPSTPIQIVAAPPIDSLKELRRQNSALLQRDVAGQGTSKPSAGELLGFLEAASKLGRLLNDDDERETAQGIMDGWVAAVLNLDSCAGSGSRPFVLEDYDPSKAAGITEAAASIRFAASAAVDRATTALPTPPDLDGLKKSAVEKFVDFMPTWTQPILRSVTGCDADAGAEVAQRLLLKFIRLKENSMDAYSVPVAADDEILRDPKSKALLQRLIEAGVVTPQQSTGDAPTAYVLAHESLITKWLVLADFVKQRKAFRELTRGWENGGRQREALLHSGEQLAQAIDFPHLDTTEAAFLEASRRAGDRARNWTFSVVATLAVILGLMNWSLSHKSQVIKDTNKDLKARNLDLHYAQDAVEAANSQLQHQLALARTSAAVLKSLDQLLAESERTPAAVAVAKQVSKDTRAAFRDADKATAGRQNIELLVGIGVDPKSATPLVEALRSKGFHLFAGTPLPLKFIESQTTVRSFFDSDRELARKVGEIIAPVLIETMLPEQVLTRLNKPVVKGQSDELSNTNRQLLRDLYKTNKIIRDNLIDYDDENDPDAPKGYIQIVIEPNALPVYTNP